MLRTVEELYEGLEASSEAWKSFIEVKEKIKRLSNPYDTNSDFFKFIFLVLNKRPV
jgi:hypothetical protein